MPARPGTVELGGRRVGRVGLSLAGLRTTGMWGEPRDRAAGLRTVRRAAELGVELVEVPAPFGPWADLVRQAADPEALVLALRLTGTDPARDLAVTRRRLGDRLAARIVLVLAGPAQVEAARIAAEGSGVAVGAWVTAVPAVWPPAPLAALRGPMPAPATLIEECERRGIPCLSADPRVLAAGAGTVALLEPAGPAELDRLYEEAVTPPAAGPG